MDRIWPVLTGNEDTPEDVVCLAAENIALLSDVEIVAEKRMAEADDRYRHVERKLLALLTLTTVFSAVITAGVVSVATLSVGEPDRVVALLMVVVVAYIALHLARALIATIKGLKRRNFHQLGVKDISPGEEESAEEYRLRILNHRVKCTFKNESVVSQMVDQMEVAHVAIINVLGATLLLIVSAIIIAVVRLFTGW